MPPVSTLSSEDVLARARAAGFDLAALVPLAPPRRAEAFRAWIAAGHHADMAWLERQRERILDPRQVLPGEGTLLVVGLGHAREAVRTAEGARIARYAAGRDYHNLMTKRLRRLARELTEAGLAGRTRAIVDAGPLLERAHAAEAGLGFESKAANLLHPDHGPWFFLGELLLEAELPAPPSAPPAGSCGTCTACLDACPTEALVAPGVLDARLCLSYHTIENRGTIPHELRASLGPWVFGCDVCSEVCPWGREAPDRAEVFGTHPAVEGARLVDWLALDEEAFRERFRGSPLQRPKRAGLLRNAALVLGNLGREEALTPLTGALEDPAPEVRAAAFWALHRAFPPERVEALLTRALEREEDPATAADYRRTLAGEGRSEE